MAKRTLKTLKADRNQDEAIKAFRTAQASLRQAKLALDAAKAKMIQSGSWYLVGDVAHYAQEVGQLLSCDDGECGIDPLLAKLISEQKGR